MTFTELHLRTGRVIFGNFQVERVESGDRKPHERAFQSIDDFLCFVGDQHTADAAPQRIYVPVQSVEYFIPAPEDVNRAVLESIGRRVRVTGLHVDELSEAGAR